MRFPKWSLLSFLVVVFLPLNLCVALASSQAKSTSLGATQEPPSEYQSGKIVAVQTTEWQTEYVVQISIQVKDTVYTGEYVTEEKSMAPPSGLVNEQPVSVRLVKGKMFLKLANGEELITYVIK
jgi:co-chaperonin GroES (HSP10)